ncbi:MAG: TonB-dependent receptor plug domain-containing protein, partial [Desulfobacterales bacterium]|nr:TonB-dependent receptor plug domain-containing protein [Desulfobacterales bacterium]
MEKMYEEENGMARVFGGAIFFLCLVFGLALPLQSQGEEKREKVETQEEVIQAEEIVVHGSYETNAAGLTKMDTEMIRYLTGGNGGINELLLVLPDIQPDDTWRSQESAGEILPTNLSISGGKAYQNNFTIDGVSNNSLLDPGSDRRQKVNDVPGHPQEVFLDADLVEEITVYDSNVPARFGDFSGGVVDAKTIKPGIEAKGKIYYHTTRDEWAHFFDPKEDEDEEKSPIDSGAVAEKPRFTKHRFGGNIRFSASESVGVVGSYSGTRSTLSKQHFTGWKDETRQLDSFMGKLTWDPDYTNALGLTLI